MLNVPRDLTLFELGETQHLIVTVKPPARKVGAKKTAVSSKKHSCPSPYEKAFRKRKVQDGPSGPMLQDGPSGPMLQDGPSGPMFQDGPSGPMFGGSY